MRATLSDAGIPQAAASYDAWGVPETPLIASFGFTGELQQGSDVWLRARWYGAGRGAFGGRDPWEGNTDTPYSLHYYQYGYSLPTRWVDPTGYIPEDILWSEGVYIGALIQMDFVAGNPDLRVAEFEIPKAGKKLGAPGFADMVDFGTGEVYEIKPKGKGKSAEEQLGRYLFYLARAAVLGDSGITAPLTGQWMKGTSYLSDERFFGLWPYGLDPRYQPGPNAWYYVVKAQRTAPGIIEYWGEKVDKDKAERLAWNYDPNGVNDFINETWLPEWRKGKWPDQQWPGAKPYPHLYPNPPQVYALGDACWHLLIWLSEIGEDMDTMPDYPMVPGQVPPILVP